MVDEADPQKQARARSGFIRAYGMFWVRDEVDWWAPRSSAELLGRVNKNKGALRVANFWEQRGIYVLYNDHGPYYVGKTFDQPLGVRLRQHTKKTSPHAEAWTRFSWWGWRRVLTSVDESGLQRLASVPQRAVTDSKSSVNDIEALLIEAMGTRWVGNRRSESFAAAVKWEQVWAQERDLYVAKVER